MAIQIKEIPISQVKLRDRFRKDFGNLNSLAESIKKHGLLQPIGVNQKNQLVFGERRLRACESILKWKKIPSVVVNTKMIASAEIDENVVRKDFTVTERVSIVEALHSFEHGGNRRSTQAEKFQLEKLTLAEACQRVGWSTGTYRNAKSVIKNGISKVVEAMDSEKLSIAAACALAVAAKTDQQACMKKRLDVARWTTGGIKKQLRRVTNERKREAALSCIVTQDFDDRFQLFHCRFQALEKTANLKPNSAGLVVADIPYGSEFGLDQIEELAKFSKRFLMNGGTFVCHLGQTRLPEKLETLSRHLDYRWTICSSWNGVGNPIFPLNMISKWIPIAVFSKGKWSPEKKWVDLICEKEKEKDFHAWQRNELEMEEIVTCFSVPGSTVIDPVMGSGTAGVACFRLGRRFVGCDADKAAVISAQRRLKDELNNRPVIIPIKGTTSKKTSRRKVAVG